MRVAALLPHVEIFGGVRRYLELGNALVRRRHRFVLFTPDGAPPEWLRFEGESRPFSSLGEEAFDAAVCSEYAVLDAFAAVRSERKYFYFVLEGHRREREVASRRDLRFLGNSGGICRRIERKYGTACLRAAGGIDPALFRPLPRPDFADRADGEFRVLCYGRILKRRKGIHHVIRAVEGLRRDIPGVRLVLFDSPVGRDRRDPRPLVRTTAPVEFHWELPQDRMAWLYSRADVFVSAERRAGWSNGTAEAMACGIPVVCTPSGTRDFAVDGDTALVAPLPLPILLRSRIRRLHRDRDLRRRLSEAGPARMAEFTWDRLAERLEAILSEGCASGRPLELIDP